METSAKVQGVSGNPALPDDLAEWLGAVRLTNLALQSVADLESPRTEFRAPGATEGHGFRMLLTLLSYAYARGIYGSAELSERIPTDTDLRYLAASDSPDAQTIRYFRRLHWPLLRSALTQLVALAAGNPELDTWFNASAEAARRLEHAAAADSLALDD